MKALVHREFQFLPTLKSAAGFAVATAALVGMLVGLLESDPANARWLVNIAALVGAIAGAIFGGTGAKE
jgi:hypothetical protein